MACSTINVMIPAMDVWTKGSDANRVQFRISGFQSTAGIKDVRPILELLSLSGGLVIEVGYETANNEGSPDAIAWLANFAASTEGVTTGTWTDIASALAAKASVRWWLGVKNANAGTLRELGRIMGGRIELR